MIYEILESRIEFIDNRIYKITVLINCTGRGSKQYSDVRAIYANTKPIGGYFYIPQEAQLNTDLLQKRDHHRFQQHDFHYERREQQ